MTCCQTPHSRKCSNLEDDITCTVHSFNSHCVLTAMRDAMTLETMWASRPWVQSTRPVDRLRDDTIRYTRFWLLSHPPDLEK